MRRWDGGFGQAQQRIPVVIAIVGIVNHTDETNQLRDEIIALELRLLNPAVLRLRDAVDALLADSFVEFGKSGGVYTKSEIIAELASEQPADVKAVDFVVTAVTPQVALATYRTIAAIGGARRSSLWVDGPGGWRMVFHQGTPAVDSP
jgi:hypothetical protein